MAIAGGVLGAFLRARFAQQTRIQEEIASKKVVACEQAYAKIKYLESLHGQAHDGYAFKALMGDEKWFWEQRLYLPGEFAQHWIDLKGVLRRLGRNQNYGKNVEGEIEKQEALVGELIRKAIGEVYTVTKNKPLVARMPERR